jgi:hypothetical protein
VTSDRLPYVRLDDDDNIVVLVRHVDEGDAFPGTSGETWTMSEHLDVGNKLAAHTIEAGERVVKLGVPIGTATVPIAAGAHVHSHNLRSDYIPFDIEAAQHAEHSAH